MTFFWGMSSHLDEADSMSWLKRPKKRTSPQIFMSPDSLRVMVIRHPFERLASLYNYIQQGLRVSNLTGGTNHCSSNSDKMLYFSLLSELDWISSDRWNGRQNPVHPVHTIFSTIRCSLLAPARSSNPSHVIAPWAPWCYIRLRRVIYGTTIEVSGVRTPTSSLSLWTSCLRLLRPSVWSKKMNSHRHSTLLLLFGEVSKA